MNVRRALPIAALAIAITCAAQTADPTLSAAQRWVGRSLILRGFYAANELHYDASGKVDGSPKSTDWTLAGVDLDAAKRVDAETIELDGLRVAIRYNPDNQLFERHPQKDQPVRILVGIRKAGSSANVLLGIEPIEETLGEIFAMGLDPALQRSMPDFWQHYFNPSLTWTADGLDDRTIYPIKGSPAPADLTAPAVTHKTNAPETPEAEKDKVRSPVSLRLVVDAQGHARRITILKPLGYGLDALAAQSARGWTFTPGRLAGEAVSSKMDVAEDFAPPPAKAPGH